MHLPPAAAWPVDSARWLGRALGALALAAALANLYFGLRLGWGASSIGLMTVSAVCTAGAAMGLSTATKGQLRWDGERWYWSDGQDHAVIRLACAVDLQHFLLLHIALERGAGRWLCLHSPAMDGHWLALRRAVVAAQQSRYQASARSLPE